MTVKQLYQTPVSLHYPANADSGYYQDKMLCFRMHQIKTCIASYPPKVQIAMLDWLEQNIL